MRFTSLKEKARTIVEAWSKADRRRRRRGERGMTLVEIMVVVVIISMVMGVVGVAVFGRLKEAQRNTAFTQIKQIAEGLDHYKLQYRKYPSTSEGLAALTQPKGSSEPIMTKIPKDPWDNEYVYIFPGSHNQSGFDLISVGPDGVQGGGDDITNWGGLEGEQQ